MKRPVAFVVLAGVAALLASVLVYSALKKREAEVQEAKLTTVELVVAAHDLPLGAKIDPTAVKMVRWSRDSVPPGSFTDIGPVLNAFVKGAIVENEPLVGTKLFMGEKTAGVMPLLIPPGMRAMSVPVDEVSDIAGFVMPHARVDILVALSSTGGTTQKSFSKVVLQNVEVLAVAQEIEGKRDEPEVAKVVTVLVTPQDAEKLALATHEGTLRLAMRNYNDDKIVMTAGSDVEGMLRSFSSVPVMAQQPLDGHMALAVHVKPQVQIEIMRDGKTRQSVRFVREAALGPASLKGNPRIGANPRAEDTFSEVESPDGADGSPVGAVPGKPESPEADANPAHNDGAAAFGPNSKTVNVP